MPQLASGRLARARSRTAHHGSQVVLRDATVDDAEAIARIYAYYCERTTVTFQVVPSTADEIAAGIAAHPAGQLPYLVAVQGNQIVGYSYAGLLRAREGYASSCEVGIYLKCVSDVRGDADRAGGRIADAASARRSSPS